MSSSRLRELDGLRGLAAIGVVAFHFLYQGPREFPNIGASIAPFVLGRQGVQLFFVISGFVIMMSLERSTVRQFSASRVSRLFPTYWAAVIVTWVIAAAFLPGYQVSSGQAAANLTMVQTYFGVPYVDGTYWTLSIELAFYVQAAVLYKLGFFAPHRLPWTLLAWLGFVGTVVVGIHVAGLESSAPLLYHDLSAAFDFIPFFVAGICVLQIYRHRSTRLMIGVLVAATLMMLCLSRFADVGIFGFVYAAVMLTVLMWRPLGTSSRPLVFLGEISFALYVIHEFIGYVVILRLMDAGMSRWVATGVAVIVVLLLATAITSWIDKPLRRRVRNLIGGKRAKQVSVAA